MTDFELHQTLKRVRNLCNHYKRNWPFRTPKTELERFLVFFRDFRFVRRYLGGRWLRGPWSWLWINDNWDAELSNADEDYEKVDE
jgi:hypothetical protein